MERIASSCSCHKLNLVGIIGQGPVEISSFTRQAASGMREGIGNGAGGFRLSQHLLDQAGSGLRLGRDLADVRVRVNCAIAAHRRAQTLAAKPFATFSRKPASTRQDVRKAIEPVAQNLLFSIDDDTGRTIVKVVDAQTDEVIRQMPSEEVLAISKAIDKLKGVLIQQKA